MLKKKNVFVSKHAQDTGAKHCCYKVRGVNWSHQDLFHIWIFNPTKNPQLNVVTRKTFNAIIEKATCDLTFTISLSSNGGGALLLSCDQYWHHQMEYSRTSDYLYLTILYSFAMHYWHILENKALYRETEFSFLMNFK